jgi:Fur family ferric uptake transcriptional regulator
VVGTSALIAEASHARFSPDPGSLTIFDKIRNLQHDGLVIAETPSRRADILREHGVQVTAQRLAIMRALAVGSHQTADEVAEIVRSEIGAISRQAVYDSLGVLVDKGLLRRIQPAGSAARYEHRVGDNHHHLVCRQCGATVDIDCAVGAAPCLDADDDRGYEVEEAEVIFWGRCPNCRKGVGDQ